MRVITAKKDMLFSDLVTQAFTIQGKGSAETRRRAEAAILAANPQFAALGRIPENAAIIVPDVPDARAKQAAQPVAAPAQAILDDLARQLDGAAIELIEAAKEDARGADSTLQFIGDPGFQQALHDAASQQLFELVESAEKTSKERIEALDATVQSIDERIQSLHQGLKDMRSRLG